MRIEGDNMMGVKRTNRAAALQLLHNNGSVSRKRLAENMGLTPAAITKIVGELIDEGLITNGSAISGGGAGRREIMISLNPGAHCALGVLINTRVAVLSAIWLDGSVIFSEEFELEAKADAETTIDELVRRIEIKRREYSLTDELLIGIGIAVRGIVSEDGRVLCNSFGALNAENYPFADVLEARTGLKTVMSNNVRALFAAHIFLSRDKDVSSQFFLRGEYGIGGSLSINGRIWSGSSQQCSEIGHVPALRHGGRMCVCGKRGCLETISSPTAILTDARWALSKERTPLLYSLSCEKGIDGLTLTDVFESARNGDKGCIAIINRAVEALGNAIKNVIYVVDPQKIVLYGRMFDNDYYLSKLEKELRIGIDSRHSVTIEKSRFNHQLEDKAAGLLVVSAYYENGGMKL